MDDSTDLNIPSNENLAAKGKDVIESTLTQYIRWALPHLPDEGVHALRTFLTTEKMLAHVSFHIGTMDLIMTEVIIPSTQISCNKV